MGILVLRRAKVAHRSRFRVDGADVQAGPVSAVANATSKFVSRLQGRSAVDRCSSKKAWIRRQASSALAVS